MAPLPLLLLISALLGDDAPPAGKLAMTKAVACSTVTGYGDFVPLDEAVLTRDDKLLLYYEPSGYAYEQVGREYHVHLIQDARVRRKGEKTVLQAKDKLLDYKGKSKTPPLNVFLANTITLKPLPPGEYELEIILRDAIGKGPPATQILKFRVKAVDAPKGRPDPPGGEAPGR